MSLSTFFALCILGCDFLIFILFQWVYSDKRRLRHIRSLRQAGGQGKSPKLPLIPASTSPAPRRSSTPLRLIPPSPTPSTPSRTRERIACRGIAASPVRTPTRSRL